MAKQIVRVAKLEFNAGQAKPGPELAGLGIVMPEFTKQFNDQTRDRGSEPVPVEITIYKDKSFTFKLFTAPAAYKLIQAAKIQKGSPNSKTTIAGTITVKQLQEIAEYKLVDLNTATFDFQDCFNKYEFVKDGGKTVRMAVAQVNKDIVQ